MLSLPSNPGSSEISEPLTPSSQESEDAAIPTEQMFRLIDSILPFEACLYHQVLPLALEGRYLRLGMVLPHDSSALDYVRRILAYLNCSFKTEPISAEVHQSMLSAYLKYTRTSSPPQKPAAKKNRKRPSLKPLAPIVNHSQSTEKTLKDKYPKDEEAPRAFEEIGEENNQPPFAPAQPRSLQNGITVSQRLQARQEASPPPTVAPLSPGSPSAEALQPLELQALYLTQPVEFIAMLPPQQLLQELLARVLMSGIGRLYFERQSDRGRILWSQEGVLQSVLDGLTLPVFQGVIIELKRFVNLPLLPVVQPKQVEIERCYQQERLVLRLRVMPGNYGEEATLQVLRGVALKFYQRQQIEKLSQNALKLAQQLQQTLDELYDRSSRSPMPLEAMPALNQLLQGCDKQLEALAALQANQHYSL